MILFAVSTFFTIMSNLFVIGEAEFFAHKQKMEKLDFHTFGVHKMKKKKTNKK